VAAAELGRRGYRIVASNYRCRSGEIDFVAQESGCLVFIEVRCKRSDSYGTAAESVTRSKQAKIVAAAERYLDEMSVSDTDCRFDVVTVVPRSGRLEVDEIIRDAFQASR